MFVVKVDYAILKVPDGDAKDSGTSKKSCLMTTANISFIDTSQLQIWLLLALETKR